MVAIHLHLLIFEIVCLYVEIQVFVLDGRSKVTHALNSCGKVQTS